MPQVSTEILKRERLKAKPYLVKLNKTALKPLRQRAIDRFPDVGYPLYPEEQKQESRALHFRINSLQREVADLTHKLEAQNEQKTMNQLFLEGQKSISKARLHRD